VAPADRSELITFGVGLGEGDGDGVGVGVGVGVAVGVAVGVGVGVGGGGAICACAVDTTPMVSTNATAASRINARPAPIFPVRDGRDEQRMHSNPKRRSASSKMRKI
jgi:hypothetical protein